MKDVGSSTSYYKHSDAHGLEFTTKTYCYYHYSEIALLWVTIVNTKK